ncbi:Coenzyme PQQ synthesis protein D [bacterium HR37]|nr:Coenzyme PQQ synthesis protein D [bacterium HR37]
MSSEKKEIYRDRKFRRREGVFSEELEGEIILFDSRTKNTYVLNQIAGVIWDLCDGENTPAQISLEISSALKVDSEVVLNDVLNTIEYMLEKGLVEVE